MNRPEVPTLRITTPRRLLETVIPPLAVVCILLALPVAAAATLETGPAFTFPAGSHPTSLIYGPQSSFWLTLLGKNSLASLSLPSTVFSDTLPTANARPFDLIIGPDQALWFSEHFSSQIGRYDLDLNSFDEYPLPEVGSTPAQLALGQEGNLWFTEVDGNRIGRISPQGAITELDLPHANSTPIGIATALDGALWFTQRNGHRLGRIYPLQQPLEITEFDLDPLRRPTEIILGPDGNLWFIYEVGKRVVKVDPEDGDLTTYTLPITSTSLLDLAIGPDGRIWFLGAQTIGSFALTAGAPDDLQETYLKPAIFEGQGNSRLIAGPGAEMFYIASNSQSVYTATVEGGAQLRDLQLFLKHLPPLVLAAGEFYLTADLQNWSDSTATGVEITLTLDANLEFVNLETPGGAASCAQVNLDPPQVACDLGNLAAAQTLPLTYTLQTTRLNSYAVERLLSLNVLSAEGDYLPANNRILRGLAIQRSIDYFNDFTFGSDDHWSHSTTSHPLGDLIYLGEFSNDRVTFTFADLPPHDQAQICFDLYVLGPWDGSNLVDPGSSLQPPPVIGPDLWAFFINDNRQLSTSFSNVAGLDQAFTADYLQGIFPARYGALQVGEFDADPATQDARYHLCAYVGHTLPDFIATFNGLNLDAFEHWALDNVSLKIFYQAVYDWIYLPLVSR